MEVEVEDHQVQTPKMMPPVKDTDLEGLNNFMEVKVGDQVKFECNICQKKLNRLVGVKNHIRMMHIKRDITQKPTQKRKKASDYFEEDDEIKKARMESIVDDTEEFMRKIDEIWNKSVEEENENSEHDEDKNDNNTQSQSIFSQEQSPPSEQQTQEIYNLDEAKTMIDSLRQEVEVAKSNAAEDKFKIESLEEAIKTKNETIDICKATINSIEVDKMKKETCINRSKDVFKTLEKKIVMLENYAKENTNAEQAKKVVKAEDDVKKYKKETAEKEKKLKETISKLNKETETRSKAQAEVTRVNKMTNNMAKIIEKKEEWKKKEEREKQNKRSPRKERYGRNKHWETEERN